MIIRRIEPLSLARLAAVFYGSIGLVVGALVTLLALVGSSLAALSEKSPLPFVGVFFGVGAIVLFPILYGVLGFVLGLIWAWLYNFAARFAGGIAFEVEGR